MHAATPQDLSIEPRNVMFARNRPTARHWNGGDPVATAFYNALSLTFPKGEAFFIESVRAFREFADGELKVQIDAFIKQEAAHSREHHHFNTLVEKSGFDSKPIIGELDKRLEEMSKNPALFNLVTTAALEHFTAIFAHVLLKHGRHLNKMPPEVAKLWQWHAIEEIEHKAVAYDTLNVATRHLSAYKRWKLRSLIMLNVSYNFIRARLRAMHEFFRQDGIDGTKMRLKALWFLFGYPGILRQMLPMWLSFFSPRFHPWQHDDRHLIDEHLPQLGMPKSGGDALIKLT